MKKFISFVMAAAMVASLVPATAFAKGDVTATAKIIDALNITRDEARDNPAIVDSSTENAVTTKWDDKIPELQLTITNTDYRDTKPGDDPTLDVTLTLDNASFAKKNGTTAGLTAADLEKLVSIVYDKRDASMTEFVENNVSGTDLYKKGGDTILISGIADNNTSTGAGEGVLTWLVTPVAANGTGGAGQKFDLSGVTGSIYFDSDNSDSTPGTEIIRNGAFVNGTTDVAFAGMIGDVAGGGTNAFQSSPYVDAGHTGTTIAIGSAGFVVKVQDASNEEVEIATATLATDFPELSNRAAKVAALKAFGYVQGAWQDTTTASPVGGITWKVKDFDDDQVTYTFTGMFAVDDIIVFDLDSVLDKKNVGRNATVSVSSKAVDASDLVYVSVKGREISATTRKVGSIAEEEVIGLESDIKVSSSVSDFVNGQYFELKLSKGFEFDKLVGGDSYSVVGKDGNTAWIQFISGKPDSDAFTIDKENVDIESTSAKSGSTCTMTVKALDYSVDAKGDKVASNTPAGSFVATTTVEILKVVDYKVELTVDEDEDVPVIYSGVNVDNYGITDDSDHWSLEVTAKETFPGAWSMRKGFNFELPEHVYVADLDGVDVTSTENFYWNGKEQNVTVDEDDVEAAFWNAYQNGKHINFEFDKRVFDDVDSDLRDRECAEMTFKLKLVADPGFEGDVVLKLTGELVDEQEVTIAKFVKPYEVKAEQNDLIIDYRYTDVPTDITITETEKGLWAKNEAEFRFGIETGWIEFEDDPTFEIDSKSDLEIKDNKADGGVIKFTVKAESDDAATVTMKDMQLFMNRSVPAGPYDLLITSSLEDEYLDQVLFAPDNMAEAVVGNSSGFPTGNEPALFTGAGHHGDECNHDAEKSDSYVGCVADYSNVVKEAFVNVVTAGRDVDDASFTTKVVVPVGESYIVAGEKQIELDTPAYINEAGYTMLPIRAVATALGINNNNVLWDQPTKTVTILYGQRIITMTQGQKVVYVNGSAIPASAAVENTNSRTFLPMRDLATALGVTDITWDQATRTATLNGNQNTAAAK